MSYAVDRPVSTIPFTSRPIRPLPTSQPDAPYIPRPADAELLRTLQAGKNAYILAARQSGKSRLLSRTQDELTTRGYRCVKLDLGAFSFESTPAQWYRSLAREIATSLGQPPDFAEILLAPHQSPSQQFAHFLQAALRLRDAPLVIFLDEVEGIFTMPSAVAADFMTALQSCVGNQTSIPRHHRLSFCLMGACTPAELMHGGQHPLFAVAHEITLTDFNWASVRASSLPLFAEQGPQNEAALARVYYWTQGHPHLTQRLCEQLCAPAQSALTPGSADRLVYELFLGPMAREQEDFQELERRFFAGPSERVRRRLTLYRRLLSGDKVPVRRSDLVQLDLRLAGLVKLVPGAPPFLAVRNPIFSSLFNASWARQSAQFANALTLRLDGKSPSCAESRAGVSAV